MAGASGKSRRLLVQNLLGMDERVWAQDGTSQDLRGVLADPLGWLEKAKGLKVYTTWTGANPLLTTPAYGLGSHTHGGNNYLLAAFDGGIHRYEGKTMTELASGRFVATSPAEADRFSQVGNFVIITNGVDQNLKYDGVRISKLGPPPIPQAPRVVLVQATSGAAGVFTNRSLKGGTDIGRARYKVTHVNHYGQEGEASDPSDAVDFDDVAAGVYFNPVLLFDTDNVDDEVADTMVYRSVDEGAYYLIGRVQGPLTNTYCDVTKPGLESVDVIPDPGSNLSPPISKWCFPFDGRVYYGGCEDSPSYLWFSRLVDGTPAPEAVSSTNFIDVSSSDGDELTGWALAQDFALIFKNKSIHMLTHDKNRNPVIRPINAGYGAVSDRAVVQVSGVVYFLSEHGVHAFDGSRVSTISRQVETRFRGYPRALLEDSFGFQDLENRRVVFSIREDADHRLSLVVQLDMPDGVSPISTVPQDITAAIEHRGRLLACAVVKESPSPNYNLCELFVQDGTTGISDHDSKWRTSWQVLGDPDAIKTIKKVELLYRQMGDHELTLSWFRDWDERTAVATDTVAMIDPSAEKWDTGVWDATNKVWDHARVRTVIVWTPGLEQVRSFALQVATTDPKTPWEVIGAIVYYVDHGDRTVSLDGAES